MISTQTFSNLGSSLRSHIKAALKSKKMTYRDLAKLIHVSEVTVKRWMTTHDMQLETLIKVCGVLGINPISLVETEYSSALIGQEFTLKQESFLAVNPIEFLIFTKALMGHDFDEIRAHCKLSLKQMLKSCRTLEKQELLQLESKNKMRMLVQGPFHWRKNGTLEKNYFQNFRDAIYIHMLQYQSTVAVPNADDITLFRPFEFYLDPATASEMSTEFARLLMKYRLISHKNVRKWKSKKPVAGIIAMNYFDAWSKVFLEKH